MKKRTFAPVTIGDATDKWNIIRTEGDTWFFNEQSGLGSARGVATPFTSQRQFGGEIPVGFNVLLKSISITASDPCDVFGYVLQNINTPLEKNAQPIACILSAGELSYTINYGDGIEIRSGGSVRCTAVATTSVLPALGVTMQGIMYTDDDNYTAPFIYMPVGDSISWTQIGAAGGTGSVYNQGNRHYSRRISNQLLFPDTSIGEKEINVRVVNKGAGGATSVNVRRLMEAGYFDAIMPNLITIGLGTNDASAAAADTGTNMFSTNIRLLLDYFYKRNRNVSIILLGPPGSDTTGRITNLPSYRTALQAIISSGDYDAYDLQYIDTSTGLTVDNTNYTEQTVNGHIHPRGDTGHVIMYNNIWPAVKTSQFYLNPGGSFPS